MATDQFQLRASPGALADLPLIDVMVSQSVPITEAPMLPSDRYQMRSLGNIPVLMPCENTLSKA